MLPILLFQMPHFLLVHECVGQQWHADRHVALKVFSDRAYLGNSSNCHRGSLEDRSPERSRRTWAIPTWGPRMGWIWQSLLSSLLFTHLPADPWPPDVPAPRDAVAVVPRWAAFSGAVHVAHDRRPPRDRDADTSIVLRRFRTSSWRCWWPAYRRPGRGPPAAVAPSPRPFRRCCCCCCWSPDCCWAGGCCCCGGGDSSRRAWIAGVICWRADSHWTRSASAPTAGTRWE